MKFVYEYRTKDNVRHTGVISAFDREAAFAALKAQGIRPGSVTDAPGFFNKLFGRGKRWIAIVALAVLAGAFALIGLTAKEELKEATATFDSIVRRQVIGDAAIIAKGLKDGWADVFDAEGDRFLASFAVPGVPAGQRNTTQEAMAEALSREVVVSEGDGIEARQIKAIVSGMKVDIRARLKNGWTVQEIGDALVRRQEQEIAYYQRAKNEIEQAKGRMSAGELEALWEKRNGMLRGMGIRLVPLPE